VKSGPPHPYFRRTLSVAATGLLVVGLTGCTGRGGGQLPRDSSKGFTGSASFGFSFSCEDKGGLNPPTGRLHIELSYTDHGANPIGSSFGIHGIVDTIDPVVESAVCIGQNPAPYSIPENQLIFLGRYYLTSSAPADFPSTCPTRESATTPLCRFEVMVQDNDKNRAASTGDYFSIKLSRAATPCPSDPLDFTCSQLPAGTVFYTRGGVLSSGNITVG